MKTKRYAALPSIVLCLILVTLAALPPLAIAASATAPQTARPSSVAATSAANSLTAPALAAALNGLPRPVTGALGGVWQAAFARRENRQSAAPEIVSAARNNADDSQAPAAAPQPPSGPTKNTPQPSVLRPEKGATLSTANDQAHVSFEAGGLPQAMVAVLETDEPAALPTNFALLGPIVTVRGRWLDLKQAGRVEAEGIAADALQTEGAALVAALDPEAIPVSQPGGGKPEPVASRFWATVRIALPSPEAAAPNVAIARLAADGKKWELLQTAFQDGFAVAKTDHLGSFALVKNMALSASDALGASVAAAGEVIVDDLDSGFQRFEADGSVNYFWDSACSSAGCWAGHAYWTWNRSNFEPLPLDQPWNWATWTPILSDPGFYKVEVFIPSANATTTGATYKVHHAGGVDAVTVNQLTNSGAWKNIGAFEFTAGGGEHVYLSDVVPEQAQLGSRIGYDAVRFTFCPDPAACQPDLEPPVIHSVDRWLNGQGRSVFSAKVTDNVKVAEVVLIFNGVSLTMTPKGGDIYEVEVPIPLAKISQAQVVATDTSGNTAVFPPGTLINIRGYLSRGLGGSNIICANNTTSCAAPPNNASNADPVNTAYGNFFYPVSLLTIPGPGDSDIAIALAYNSLAGEPVGTIQYTPDGDEVVETPLDVHVEPFGLGWTFSLGPSLLILNNTLFTGVQVRYPDGRTVNFAASGGGFTPDNTRVYDTLTADGGGYLLARKDLTQYHFDADGKLTSITDRNGNSITLTYDGDKLTRAQNSAGRWVMFSHNGDGQVIGLDASEGRHLSFAYTDKLLTAITDGAGNTTRYQYNGDRRLAQVITPKGHPSLHMSYDEVGRVTEQIEGAAAKTTFVYDDGAHTTTVTDVLGNVTTHVYDAKFRLIESRDALGAAEKFGYDANDHRTSFTDREGRQWTYSYDDQGNRLTESGPLGWQRAWTYNGLDLVTYQKDALNRETRWAYDARGNLVKIINPDLAESDITVDGRGLPIAVIDFNRKTTNLTYDAATGDLLTLTDPESHSMGYSYDGLGRVASMTDFNGQTYRYGYNGNDKLTAVDGPLGYHVGYEFDANGNLVRETDPNGGALKYSYDASENLIGILQQLDFPTVLTYDAMNHLASETDAEGRITTYVRDTVYRVTEIRAPENATTKFVYDKVDNVVETTDPEGRITRDTFDALNRRTERVANFAAGGPQTADTNVSTRWEYDLAGNIKKATDGNGNATLFDYDQLNRKVHEANAEAEVTRFEYSPMGDLLKRTDPRGSATAFTYDGNGRRTLLTDALGNQTRYLYDPNGNLTDVVDPLNVVTHNEFDALNRRTATIQNYRPPLVADSETNVRTGFGYDLAGNLTRVTDPKGNVTRYDFDAAHRLIQITDATGHSYAPYDYDKVDNRTVVRDANGNPTLYLFDGLNRPVRQTDPEGHVETYTYDRIGNRRTVADGRTFLTETQYDPLNRPVKIIAALPGVMTTMTYDAVGTLKTRTDPAGHTETFTHDQVYRVLTRADGAGNAWRFEYDDAGNLDLAVDPNGNATDYTLDELNRLTQVKDAENGVTRHDYDALGNETHRTAPNGVVAHFAYDPLYRLSSLTRNYQPAAPAAADVNVIFRYRYDAASNLTEEVDALSYATRHQYNALNRRIGTTDAENGQTDFSYDHVGNLTGLTNPRRYSTAFEYTRDNLLTLVRDAKGSEFKFDYDAAHNLTQATDPHDIVTRGEFDALNRLIASIRNYHSGMAEDHQTNVTTEYAYWPDSLLKAVRNPRNFDTQYAWDAAHRLTTVTDAQNGVTRTEYDRMDHVLAQVDANGHRTEFVFDKLYRRTAETDPEGHRQAFEFDPVGNQTNATNARGFATATTYDPLDRATRITDALNGAVTNVYDPMGNVLRRTDQNGHSDAFTYDRLHRLLTRTDSEGYITRQEYDPNSNVVKLTDGNSHASTFGYDELDRLIRTTNAEDETTRYAYDKLGNRTDLIEADSVVTHYEFDPLYRLAAVVLNYKPVVLPNAETNVRYAYGYDANDNLVRITDPMARPPTQFIQDSLDRLEKEINPLGNAWQYTYDPVGNLKTRLDANGALTRYSYFKDDLLAETAYPDNTKITRTYDPNHNLVAMTDRLGASAWVFDALDRLTSTTDALGRTLKYSYDPVGNRTNITYPDNRTVASSYYKNNWLKTVTDPLAGVTSYRRDGVGQATLTTNPNDTVAEMSYDKANRLLTLVNRQTVGAKKTISAFGYTYDEVGQRTKMDAEYGWRNPPTVSTSYVYDPLRRLVGTSDIEGVQTSYTFDAAGNRLTYQTNDDPATPKPADPRSESYAYNDANQLLTVLSDAKPATGKPNRAANVAQALAAFRHEVAAQRGKHITTAAADSSLAAADDLIGKLYSSKPPSQAATATALAALRSQVQAHRASGAIDSDGIANSLLVKLDKAIKANQGQTGELKATTYAYDLNGNRIGMAWPGPQGPHTQGVDYRFDYENMLTQALDYQANVQGNRVDRAVTTMQYDGLNRRLVKSYDPKTGASGVKRTEYAFDVLDPVAEYAMWNGQYSNYYRGEMGRMIAMQNFPSGQRYTYHHDGLGSISATTKDGGVSVHTYRYDPYGLILPENGNWTDPHNGFTFTGQEWDAETGLLHFYARDLDPLRGVWMQQDPYRGRLPEPVTLHRYGYVGGNPINNIDPFGYALVTNDSTSPIYVKYEKTEDGSGWLAPEASAEVDGIYQNPSDMPQMSLITANSVNDVVLKLNGWENVSVSGDKELVQRDNNLFSLVAGLSDNTLNDLGLRNGAGPKDAAWLEKYNWPVPDWLKKEQQPDRNQPAPVPVPTPSPRNPSRTKGGVCFTRPSATSVSWPDAFEKANQFYNLAEPFAELPGSPLAYVQGYARASGTYVNSYLRTVPGGKAFVPFSNALVLGSVALAGPSQLVEDRNRSDLDAYERAARASLNVSGTALTAAGTIGAGTAAVTAIGAGAAAISAPAWVPVAAGAAAIVGIAYGANYIYNEWLKEPFFSVFGVD